MFLEIAIVILLTVINGLLAMSELAIVSGRPARLKLLAGKGQQGRRDGNQACRRSRSVPVERPDRDHLGRCAGGRFLRCDAGRTGLRRTA